MSVTRAHNKCSKCCPSARTNALSLFLQSLMAASIMFCCRLFQASTRRCFSSSTLFIRHSYTFCCITLQTLSGLGCLMARGRDQRSPAFFCSNSLMVSLVRWDGALSSWKTNLSPAHASSLAESAERISHCGNTGRWLSFQARQKSTWSYPFSTRQCKP